MSIAEEKANEYANKTILSVNHRGDVKDAFWDGYEQAEKDLALTWEYVREICKLSVIVEFEKVIVEFEKGWEISDEKHYSEVLRRFNESRK